MTKPKLIFKTCNFRVFGSWMINDGWSIDRRIFAAPINPPTGYDGKVCVVGIPR